ncbi:FUSC family membrane protein [Cesiribacter sp. SM1]|uniref:FUSC family membrane protein n=1 Tax=Cesiribacter sp. SM1 TaxID=2861196 RepID=UPI001CD69ED4|nr:FUSC family membrane protein [Cesiribacter sp. SM1]
MGNQVREIQYFFSGQHFSDGLRVTLGILLPALVFTWFGHLELGVLLSFGALSVSISDFPGPPVHKRNGMLICCLSIFVVALITGYARMHPLIMGAEVLLFCFFFSMLAVYGNRAAAIGTAALLVMVLLMDEPQQPSEVPLYSGLVLAGGVWYMLLSLLVYQIRPYKPVQYALGECVREVARFLNLKAGFYSSGERLEESYQKVVAQQIVVNEKQEAVRELLFKSRLLVKESTNTSRRLLLIFVEVVDLFEQVMLIHYDYASLRERFEHSGILDKIAGAIRAVATELDVLGLAIQSNTRYKNQLDLNAQLEELKQSIDGLNAAYAGSSTTYGGEGVIRKEESTLVLKKVLINLKNITERFRGIVSFMNSDARQPVNSDHLQYTRFVSHQRFDRKTFFDNLSLNSSIFKHSGRVALVCLFGFVLTKVLSYGEHSYWVLLTIIVILKPAFSITKERNYQRLVGTVIGGTIGFCILLIITDPLVLFLMLVVLMIGTFSFIRINYVVSVSFMTPFILIIFSFLGADGFSLVQERIIDTLLGSAIAFTASYLIFPNWESAQLKKHMLEVIAANEKYLMKLADRLRGMPVDTADYKLARKDVYVSSANLSAAFQRMLSEPRSKQKNSGELHRFVVLNHILSSNIATVAIAVSSNEQLQYSPDSLRAIRRALAVLESTRKKLSESSAAALAVAAEPTSSTAELAADDQPVRQEEKAAPGLSSEDMLLKEQFGFINRIVLDIRKSAEAVVA